MENIIVSIIMALAGVFLFFVVYNAIYLNKAKSFGAKPLTTDESIAKGIYRWIAIGYYRDIIRKYSIMFLITIIIPALFLLEKLLAFSAAPLGVKPEYSYFYLFCMVMVGLLLIPLMASSFKPKKERGTGVLSLFYIVLLMSIIVGTILEQQSLISEGIIVLGVVWILIVVLLMVLYCVKQIKPRVLPEEDS
ncbi:hypothetical protein JXB31_05840 [Candidatus Woesearchaeota archaeon]|nr:hypothetical protein [Candidatus Woesearchaeota archaeon]